MGCTNTNHITAAGSAEPPATADLTVAPALLGCLTAYLFAESPRAGAAR